MRCSRDREGQSSGGRGGLSIFNRTLENLSSTDQVAGRSFPALPRIPSARVMEHGGGWPIPLPITSCKVKILTIRYLRKLGTSSTKSIV
jgi:hypothetical protein